VGAPGTVNGTTALDAVDDALVPSAFVAVTVNVYEVPFVRPVTVADVAVAPAVAVRPPGLDATVYPVMALPPSYPGAVHDTSACVSPATAVTPVGGSGSFIAVQVTVPLTAVAVMSSPFTSPRALMVRVSGVGPEVAHAPVTVISATLNEPVCPPLSW